MKILNVGQVVYALLNKSEELQKAVKKQIYPLIAKDNTEFPFIIYQRDNVNVDNTKDGILKQSASLSVIIASDNYAESVKLADLACEALIGKRIKIADISVKSISLVDADEDYQDDTFIQRLIINIDLY